MNIFICTVHNTKILKFSTSLNIYNLESSKLVLWVKNIFYGYLRLVPIRRLPYNGIFIFHLQCIDDDHHLTFVVTCMFFIYCHVLLFGTKYENKNKCALLYLLVMFSDYNMRLSKILILRLIESFSEHLYPILIKF